MTTTEASWIWSSLDLTTDTSRLQGWTSAPLTDSFCLCLSSSPDVDVMAQEEERKSCSPESRTAVNRRTTTPKRTRRSSLDRRRSVQRLMDGYNLLRSHVPSPFRPERKLPRIEILYLAMEHIRSLREKLDTMSSAEEEGSLDGKYSCFAGSTTVCPRSGEVPTPPGQEEL